MKNITGTVIRGASPVHLLKRVERYLRRSGTAPTTFGRLALRDPRFVFDLRRGRNIGVRMERRVNAWLDEQEKRLEALGCKPR